MAGSDRRIRKMNIVNLNHHALVQSRQNVEIQPIDITIYLGDMTRINKEHIIFVERLEHSDGNILHLPIVQRKPPLRCQSSNFGTWIGLDTKEFSFDIVQGPIDF